MTGLRTALLFLALWLFFLGMGQGVESYCEIQGGFQRDVPEIMCSPITGRTLPPVGIYWSDSRAWAQDDWWHRGSDEHSLP